MCFNGQISNIELEQDSYLKVMASIGYGYTRQEVIDLASDYAVHLELRNIDNPFTMKWFYLFMRRWPDLKVFKLRALEIARAKGGNRAAVDEYFSELSAIIKKYDLVNKPHLIFNVDEKGEQLNHKPPHIVGDAGYQPPAITASKSETITILGCGNAAGYEMPPYIVFKGQEMQSRWLENVTPGAAGTVSYLQNHFLLLVPGKKDSIELLLDDHKSHVSIPDIDWALENNVIIQVQPAHTSHFLQPTVFMVQCIKYIAIFAIKNRMSELVATKDDAAEIICSSYLKSATPENLQSAFKKTGIFPFCKDSIDSYKKCRKKIVDSQHAGPSHAWKLMRVSYVVCKKFFPDAVRV